MCTILTFVDVLIVGAALFASWIVVALITELLFRDQKRNAGDANEDGSVVRGRRKP